MNSQAMSRYSRLPMISMTGVVDLLPVPVFQPRLRNRPATSVFWVSWYTSLVHLAPSLASAFAINQEFAALVEEWERETFFHSSLSKQFTHPAYVRIIAMGEKAIPLVLKELQKDNGDWFYALKFMAGKDLSAGIEDYQVAKEAWLNWGYKNNYIQ
jgi:hypothetical protein